MKRPGAKLKPVDKIMTLNEFSIVGLLFGALFVVMLIQERRNLKQLDALQKRNQHLADTNQRLELIKEDFQEVCEALGSDAFKPVLKVAQLKRQISFLGEEFEKLKATWTRETERGNIARRDSRRMDWIGKQLYNESAGKWCFGKYYSKTDDFRGFVDFMEQLDLKPIEWRHDPHAGAHAKHGNFLYLLVEYMEQAGWKATPEQLRAAATQIKDLDKSRAGALERMAAERSRVRNPVELHPLKTSHAEESEEMREARMVVTSLHTQFIFANGRDMNRAELLEAIVERERAGWPLMAKVFREELRAMDEKIKDAVFTPLEPPALSESERRAKENQP